MSTSISIKQSYFIEDMLHKYQQYLITGKSKTVPMMPEVNLSTSMSPTTDEETSAMQQLPYREVVGILLLCTRPDIIYATTQCAKFSHNFGPTHWYSWMYILSYLSGTKDNGLVYSNDYDIDVPMGYFKSNYIHSDADFSRDKDTSKSTSGYVYILSGAPISWITKQQ